MVDLVVEGGVVVDGNLVGGVCNINVGGGE